MWIPTPFLIFLMIKVVTQLTLMPVRIRNEYDTLAD